MQDHNRYNQSNFQQSYSNQFNRELDPEFEMEFDEELDANYEMEREFGYGGEQENEIEAEYGGDYELDMGSGNEGELEYGNDYELNNELELEGESDDEFESEPYNESEYGNSYEMEQDFEQQDYENYDSETDSELESGLDYITNEQEFENWLNEVTVRDHRARNIMRSPVGRTAVRQFSKIAVKTLPRLGSAAGGWRGRIRPTPYTRPFSSQRRWYQRPGSGYRPYAYGRNIPYRTGYTPYYRRPNTPYYGQGYTPGYYRQGNPRGFIRFIRNAMGNLVRQYPGRSAYLNPVDLIRNAIIPAAATSYPVILQPADQTLPMQDMDTAEPLMPDADAMPPQPAPGQPMPPPSQEPMPGDKEFMDTEGEILDSEESFSEVSEMELASELLSINHERELDQFLSGLFKKAVGAFSKLVSTPEGKMLKDMLKKVAKKALPMIGTAAGTYLGGPIGAQAGAKAGAAAANLFELELEGMSPEDKDFELAKAYIRLAGNAAKQIEDVSTGNPAQDARQAMIEAAKRFAPGMLANWSQDGMSATSGMQQQRGSWRRRGNKIIIEGLF